MILASLYTLLLIISFLLHRLQFVAPGDAVLLFISWFVCFDLTLKAASA